MKMTEIVRKIGIEFVGQLPWGSHMCLFYKTRKDLVDILVPYFKAGLKNNELCVWITSEPLVTSDAKAALSKEIKNLDGYIRNGQIEIIDYRESYTKTGIFDIHKMLHYWQQKLGSALSRGFKGLRVSGNTSWLNHKDKDWNNFIDYELNADITIHNNPMLAICAFSIDHCDTAQIIDVVKDHRYILIRRSDKWVVIENKQKDAQSSAISSPDGREKPAGRKQKGDNNGLIKTGQASKILGVHENTIRNWSNRGIIPTYYVGSRNDRRFIRYDLENLLRKRTSLS